MSTTGGLRSLPTACRCGAGSSSPWTPRWYLPSPARGSPAAGVVVFKAPPLRKERTYPELLRSDRVFGGTNQGDGETTCEKQKCWWCKTSVLFEYLKWLAGPPQETNEFVSFRRCFSTARAAAAKPTCSPKTCGCTFASGLLGAWATPAMPAAESGPPLQGFDKVVPPFEALLKFHGGAGFEEVVPLSKTHRNSACLKG